MRDVVERAMRGDREAFGMLVNLTSDRMYAIATRILRDPGLAEDALQGALITAWRELPRLRDPDRFEAWSPTTPRSFLLRRGQASAGVGRERPRAAGRRTGGRRRICSPSPTATRSIGRSDA